MAMKPFLLQAFLVTVMISLSQEKDEFLTYPTNVESIKKHLKTERPTIGVLSMYIAGKKIQHQYPQSKNCSYIAASYVRFIEGAGARAVPIPENLSNKKVDHILQGVNGVIIPGGDAEVIDVGYDRIAKRIFEYAINQKKKGKIWPILGKRVFDSF